MNDFFTNFTRPDWPGSPDLQTLLLMIVLAFSLGLLIGFVYMWTHEALSYSRTFVGALAVLPLIMAMMMAAMFGSLLVAFGLLAVFGVVRFRNVLKDTRDTCFILLTIVEGSAVGTTRFSIALMAALGIGAAFILVRLVSFGTRQRYDAVLSLRVTGEFPAQSARLQEILKRHARRQDLASERQAAAEGADLSYRLLLRDPRRSGELRAELASQPGLQNVAIYMHEEEAEI
jgi:Domain of unknown function (DUF4956)